MFGLGFCPKAKEWATTMQKAKAMWMIANETKTAATALAMAMALGKAMTLGKALELGKTMALGKAMALG
jgi:hypothetical protein